MMQRLKIILPISLVSAAVLWLIPALQVQAGRQLPHGYTLTTLTLFYFLEAIVGALALAVLWRLVRSDEGQYFLGVVLGALVLAGYSLMRHGDLNLFGEGRAFASFLVCFVIGPLAFFGAVRGMTLRR